MAFTYNFILGKGFPEGERIFFSSWCDSVWGNFHTTPVKIAIVGVEEKEGIITTNGPCMPMKKGDLQPGDEITSNTVIGVAAADGENIPYDKPYCIFLKL